MDGYSLNVQTYLMAFIYLLLTIVTMVQWVRILTKSLSPTRQNVLHLLIMINSAFRCALFVIISISRMQVTCSPPSPPSSSIPSSCSRVLPI